MNVIDWNNSTMSTRISDKKVLEDTGRDWDGWYSWLDDRGAEAMSHKEIVSLLAAEGQLERPWWQQSVAVEYEKSRGLREAGSTGVAGFQVGVRTTLPIDNDEAWTLITAGDGVPLWLHDEVPNEPGQTVHAPDGYEYELRTIKPGERMRLRRVDPETGESSIVQVTLSPAKTGTTLGIHHEGLRDGEHREEMRAHWRNIADKILSIV